MLNYFSKFGYFCKLARNGWYTAYHYMGPSLPIAKVRKILNESSLEDFSIAWDLYYLNLTLSASCQKRAAKIFLLLYGNLAVLVRIIRDAKWVYESNNCDLKGTYEVYFPNNRKDLVPFLGYPELSITRKKTFDILNVLFHIRPSFSFHSLFTNRINYYSAKFSKCRLPKVIILNEGRSLEYRALYHHAKNKETKIEFSWRNAGSISYSPEQLSGASNLDYPGYLHRPKYEKNTIIKMTSPLSINDNILVVVPTFSSTEDVLNWIYSVTKLIIGRKYIFSVHPSYPNLKEKVLELGLGEVDENKSTYLERYSVFVGCVSTLLKIAKDNGKQIYAIGFDAIQIDYMVASLSGFKIIDASSRSSKTLDRFF